MYFGSVKKTKKIWKLFNHGFFACKGGKRREKVCHFLIGDPKKGRLLIVKIVKMQFY